MYTSESPITLRIAKVILLKQELWLVYFKSFFNPIFNCKGYSIKTRIVTYLPKWTSTQSKYCKGYSIKTRIVTYIDGYTVLIDTIAKVILLKQGLWPFDCNIFLSHFFIAKVILLKQGLWHSFTSCMWLAIFIAKVILLKQGLWQLYIDFIFTICKNCKEYSIKTRIVTYLKIDLICRS